MDKDYDAGKLLASASFARPKSVFRAYEMAFDLGALVFSEALDKLKDKDSLEPMNLDLHPYCQHLTKAQIQQFRTSDFSYL